MGCDIHLYVEKKDENGKWVSMDKWSVDPWETRETDYIDVKHKDSFYHDRNYLLFGILAGVRATHIRPISQPRGLPEDVSPEVKRHSDRYGVDGHSHSWLTLAELLAYDWNQTTKNIGVVGLLEFARFEKNGKPDYAESFASGEKIKHLTNEEMRAEVAKYQSEIDRILSQSFGQEWIDFQRSLWNQPQQCLTPIFWEEKHSTHVKKFLDEALPKLQALGSPENVRIVFFFDN